MSTAQVRLITGLPGNGKTLLTVSKIDEWYPDRPVYYHNIKGLQKSWELMPDPEKWYELPVGSVFVFDECQDVFPTRSGKVEVPEKCKAFEKLRHKGHSVILITQKPRQIDIHVRELVGEHIHVERVMGTERAVLFTWNKVCEDVNDKAERAKASKTFFNYPKDVYGQYHSAEMHTFKRKIPWPILAIPVAVGLVGFFAWMAYDTLVGQHEPSTAPVSDSSVSPIKSPMNQPGQIQTMTTEQYLAANTPRIPGLPHTAPIYDQVNDVTTAPIPKACIASAKKCICYTEQATQILMEEGLCRQIAANGFFDPTQQSHQAASALQGKAPSAPVMPAPAI